jgi:hypothetical protein
MPAWLSTALDRFIDRKPDELIGFLVITLFIAVATTGVFRLLSRGRKDVSLLLTILIMTASILSTLSVGLYDRYRQDQARRRLAAEGPAALRSTTQFFTADALAVRVLGELDTNHDNYLSVEEAAAGAAEFIERASAAAGPNPTATNLTPGPPDALDASQIRRAIRDRMGPRVPARLR